MRVILLASTKGGVGKSTLVAALAVEAAHFDSVWIADLDPQQSTAKWWRRRKGPENPMLLESTRTVSEAVRKLEARSKLRDVLIVDAPGSMMNVLDDAVCTADCIIVPLKASQKDLEARGALDDLIRRHKKEGKTLYVVNMNDARTSLGKEVAQVLGSRVVHRPVLIGNRADYVRADAKGKTGPEINGDCSIEITRLWRIAQGIASHDEKARKGHKASRV